MITSEKQTVFFEKCTLSQTIHFEGFRVYWFDNVLSEDGHCVEMMSYETDNFESAKNLYEKKLNEKNKRKITE